MPALTFSQLVDTSQSHENSLLSLFERIPRNIKLVFNPRSFPMLGSFKKAQFGLLMDLESSKSRRVCIKQCIRRMEPEQETSTKSSRSKIMVYDG